MILELKSRSAAIVCLSVRVETSAIAFCIMIVSETDTDLLPSRSPIKYSFLASSLRTFIVGSAAVFAVTDAFDLFLSESNLIEIFASPLLATTLKTSFTNGLEVLKS